MEASTKELANIFFSKFSTHSSVNPTVLKYSNIDIKIDTFRERSVSSSINSSKKLSTHLNIFSIPYYRKMEIQYNNTTWSKQVNNKERKRLTPLYATLRVEKSIIVNQTTNKSSKKGTLQTNNMMPTLNDPTFPQDKNRTNNKSSMCNSQEFTSIPISYEIN